MERIFMSPGDECVNGDKDSPSKEDQHSDVGKEKDKEKEEEEDASGGEEEGLENLSKVTDDGEVEVKDEPQDN